MNIQNIQLGLDIATAVSVIGAAIGVIFNMKSENKNDIKLRHSQLKVEQTIKVVDELLKLLNEGSYIANLLAKEAGKVDIGSDTDNEIIVLDFCSKFYTHLRYNSIVLLTPIITKEESDILTSLKEKIEDWTTLYLEALNSPEKYDIPMFTTLLDLIYEDLIKFMSSIKKI